MRHSRPLPLRLSAWQLQLVFCWQWLPQYPRGDHAGWTIVVGGSTGDHVPTPRCVDALDHKSRDDFGLAFPRRTSQIASSLRCLVIRPAVDLQMTQVLSKRIFFACAPRQMQFLLVGIYAFMKHQAPVANGRSPHCAACNDSASNMQLWMRITAGTLKRKCRKRSFRTARRGL